jgi:ClpP class serine protease
MTGDPWADSAAIVGSVAIVAGTVWKFLNGKKKKEPTYGRRAEDVAELDKRVALNEQAQANLTKDVGELKADFKEHRVEQRQDTEKIFDKLENLTQIVSRGNRD